MPTGDDRHRYRVAVSDEPGPLRLIAGRVAALADDLPFVPVGPYEPRGRQLAWRALLLVALTLAAYWPVLNGDWLWQDDRLITGDVALRTLRGLGTIWSHPLAVSAPPGVRTLWWAEHQAFGQRAAGFRTAGVLLHVATVLLAWLSMRRLAVPGAWLIAAVYAVHPAAVSNVAWVSRQGNVLGAAAAALAVWAFLVARRVQPAADTTTWTDPAYLTGFDGETLPRWPWAVLTVAALVGLVTGPAAVAVAGGVMIVLERHRARGLPRLAWAGLIGGTVLGVIGRMLWPRATASALSADGWARFLEAAVSGPLTVLHTLWPGDVPFVADRAPAAGGPFAFSLTGFAVMAVLTLCAVAMPIVRRRGWTIVLAMSVAFAVLQALPVGRPTTADDAPPVVLAADLLPYAVGLGVVGIVIGVGFRRLRRHASVGIARTVRWAVGCVLLVGLATLTFDRAAPYATADGVWQQAIALAPDGVVARRGLADRYVAEGFLTEAGLQLDRIPEPRRDAAWLQARGRVFDAQHDSASALAAYQAAHTARPDDRATAMLLADARINAGQLAQAAELYDALIAKNPADPALLTNAGLTRMRLGQHQAAADLYEKALALDPRYVPAHLNLSNALFELKRYQEASDHLQEVVRIDPRNYAAFMNAGVLLHRIGEPAKAERMFRAALTVNPASAEGFADLGIVQTAQNKLAEAVWSFTQAARLNPDDPTIAANLAALRKQIADANKPATRPGH